MKACETHVAICVAGAFVVFFIVAVKLWRNAHSTNVYFASQRVGVSLPWKCNKHF